MSFSQYRILGNQDCTLHCSHIPFYILFFDLLFKYFLKNNVRNNVYLSLYNIVNSEMIQLRWQKTSEARYQKFRQRPRPLLVMLLMVPRCSWEICLLKCYLLASKSGTSLLKFKSSHYCKRDFYVPDVIVSHLQSLKLNKLTLTSYYWIVADRFNSAVLAYIPVQVD